MTKRSELPAMAAAIIERTNRGAAEVLIAKIPTEPYQGKWTFPNGPIEPGEAPEEALRRALHSLLDVQVRIVCGQPPFDLPWDEVMCRWRFFFCEATGAKVHNQYFAATRWVARATLREYDFDPVSQQVINWLLQEPMS